MAFPVPENHKFASIALEGPTIDEGLPDPCELAPNVWALKTPPVEVDRWWSEGLGSYQLRHYHQASLFLLVTAPSDVPELMDAENQQLERAVFALVYSLLVHDAGRFAVEGHFLAGANARGRMDLRRHSLVPACYPHYGAHQARVTLDLLHRAHGVSQHLVRLYQDAPRPRPAAMAVQDHGRLRRGFNALLKGLREQYGGPRLHEFVRAIEGVVHLQAGEGRAAFAQRVGLFAAAGDGTRQILEDLYRLRNAEEHLNEWQLRIPAIVSSNSGDVSTGYEAVGAKRR